VSVRDTDGDERSGRYGVWATAWLAYASYYLGRKTFSSAKHALEATGVLTLSELGYIDSGYLALYAVGQFVSGTLGDRVGARRLVGYGMLCSAALCAAFGSSSGALVLTLIFTLNGMAQATGWPGVTRAMTEWTVPETRGSVMGLWSTCYQVGPLVAGPLASWLVKNYGWRTGFRVPALLMVAVALLVFWRLKPAPTSAGAEAIASGQASPAARASVVEERRAAQRAVVKNRLLWSYGAAYFFIKFVRYALQLWLPYYLNKQLDYPDDKAGLVSAAFEAGGFLGVISIGVLSDRKSLGRVPLSAAALGLLALALLACAALMGPSTGLNAALLAVIGFLLFAPDSILCGAAAQDVGGKRAAAMATGFVNGVGSVGAFLVGLVLPKLVKAYGWTSLFPSLVGMAALAALCLVPALRRRAV
jgi:sugar phosphate permease